MSSWRLLMGLLPYTIFKSCHCNSFGNQILLHFKYGCTIFKWVTRFCLHDMVILLYMDQHRLPGDRSRWHCTSSNFGNTGACNYTMYVLHYTNKKSNSVSLLTYKTQNKMFTTYLTMHSCRWDIAGQTIVWVQEFITQPPEQFLYSRW